VQAAVPFYPPSGPLTMSLMMPGLAKQAAERHEEVSAEVMHFGARVEPRAYPHLFMSTLGQGVASITTYRFGLKATGWEWYDTPRKVLAMARAARMIEPLAPLVTAGERPKAQVAVLHAESSDLWQWEADTISKAEVRGPWFAMRFAGHPIDTLREYMVEQGELNRYRVLFVGQRNVNRRVQEAILQWVRAGGHLWVAPGAMTRDAADQPSDILDHILGEGAWPSDMPAASHGNEFEPAEVIDSVTWLAATDEPVPVVLQALPVGGNGEIVATYRGGQAAARRYAVGEGRVVTMGFNPSFSYLHGAGRAKAALQELTLRRGESESITGATREGVPYWLDTNEAGHAVFRHAASEAGVAPVVTTSAPDVDANLLTTDSATAVFLSNYHPTSHDAVDVTVQTLRRYDHVATLSGRKVDADWDGENSVRFALPLAVVEAVVFSDEPIDLGSGLTLGAAEGVAAGNAANVDGAGEDSPAPTTEVEDRDLPALFGDGTWTFATNANREPATAKIDWGQRGEFAVRGDWDGDGVDEIGLVRVEKSNLVWRLSGTAAGFEDDPKSGFETRSFRHGNISDSPIVGDWDGDGVDTPGLVRDVRGEMRWILSNKVGPAVDVDFRHGSTQTDVPVVGDWDGDGVTTPGLIRNHHDEMRWLLTNELGPGVEAGDRRFGDYNKDLPLVGDWTGDGRDSIGIYRPGHGQWYLLPTPDAQPAEPDMVFKAAGAKQAMGVRLPVDGDATDRNPKAQP